MPSDFLKKLNSDPRITEARRLVDEAMAEYRQTIGGVRGSDTQLAREYSTTLAEFSKVRGGQLFFPYLGSGLGKGALVELCDGSVKYDFICGVGVHIFGHSMRELQEEMINAALSDVVMQGNLQQNDEAAEFAALLLGSSRKSGANLDHVFLTTSGAMANENGLKIALQHKSPADRVLAFEGCFAGRTMAMSQVSDRPAYRNGLPDTLSVDYVPFFDPEDAEGSTARALAVLDSHLSRYPGRHAVMFFELVQGEGGFYPGERMFFRSLMDRVRDDEVLVLVDEIQTFGRTEELFAFEYFDVGDLVDIVTVGKATQVCATLFRDGVKPKPGLVSQTFIGSTTAIRVGAKIIQMLVYGDYFGPAGRIAALHNRFKEGLEAIATKRPGTLRGPYGIGAMIAFEVFDGSPEKTKRFVHDLFDEGVISFTAGSSPTRVRFLPPLGVVTDEDVDEVLGIVERVIGEWEERVKS